MMKRILLSLFALCSMAVFAEDIPLSEAQTIAQKFMLRKGLSGISQPKLAYKSVRSTKGKTASQSAYYIFNADKGGYVVVAGDDRCAEILGYSDEGQFDIATAPDHVRAFLQGYADEIAALDASQAVPRVTTSTASTRRLTSLWAESTRKVIAPMLKSKWNQSAPYNTYAPTLTSGEKGVTGCVATMMAQLMYYHKYPSATRTAIPSYTNDATGEGFTVQGYPANTAIDWANMRAVYGDSYTPTEGNAVGLLMQLCGSAVQMSYASTGSSSYTSKATEMLRTVFGYDDATRNVRRANYTAEEWHDLAYNELVDGRPVGVGGVSSGGGHAFVVDGYDGDGLFHVNWGWGGTANGYFRLSVLAPGASAGIGASTSSDGYVYDQDFIIGIQKEDAKPYTPKEDAYDEVDLVSVSPWRVLLGNAGEATNTITFGYAFQEVGGTADLSKVISLGVTELTWNKIRVIRPSVLVADNSMVVGKTYKLTFYYKTATMSGWKPTRSRNADCLYATVNSTKQLTWLPQKGIPTTEYLDAGQSFVVGKEATVTYRLTNTSTVDYVRKLQLICSENNQLYRLATTAVSLEAGETREVSLTFNVPNMSTLDLRLREENVNTTLYTHVVPTSSASVTPSQIVLTNTQTEGYSTVTYDRTMAGTVVLKNNLSTAFGGVMTYRLYKHVSDLSFEAFLEQSKMVTLAGGETKTVSFDFGDVEPGYYMVKVVVNNSATQTLYGIRLKQGALVYNEKGTLMSNAFATGVFTTPTKATFVDLSEMSGITRVVPNTNPNTLYVLSDTQTALKQQLSDRNVIIGGKADKITIENLYPYFSPIGYTATDMVYRHAVGEGSKTEYDGWKGLTLPFVPQQIMVEETYETLAWVKEPNDEGRFWLKEYVGATNKDLYFEPVQQFTPNMPYMVAFPGSSFEELSMANMHVLFRARNASVKPTQEAKVATDHYRFRASTAVLTSEHAYGFGYVGSYFFHRTNYTSRGMDAFFELTHPVNDTYTPLLNVAKPKPVVTGAEAIGYDSKGTVNVYDLNGRLRGTALKVGQTYHLDAFPQGLYIIEGKTVRK